MDLLRYIIMSVSAIIAHTQKLKMGATAEIKKYWLSGGKLLTPSVYYLGNITSSQRNCTGKVYFGVAEKLFKDYSLRLCKWYKTVERILRD